MLPEQLARRDSGARQMHVLRALRGASRHARRLSTSAAAAPAGGAAAAAGRAFRVQPYDDVPLLERAPRSALPAESLAATFTRTPIGEHSEADTRRYYELTTEQIERCFPEGFGSGVLREFSATNLPALMVRPSALAARRTLDALAADSDALRSASALVLSGARGAGKSATFSYLVHSARSSGWLVLLVPSAHRYINNQQRFTPLSSLRIEIGIVCAAAEGAGQASTADRSASPLAAVGESAASLEQLFDVTAATSALLRGFLRAHEPTLASLPVQCAETRAFAKALSAQVSSLADLVQLGTVTDAAGVPTELASHTLVALVRELRRVTAVPVLIAIDDVNAFDRGVRARARGGCRAGALLSLRGVRVVRRRRNWVALGGGGEGGGEVQEECLRGMQAWVGGPGRDGQGRAGCSGGDAHKEMS